MLFPLFNSIGIYIRFIIRYLKFIFLFLLLLFFNVLKINGQDISNITKQKPFAISGNLAANGLFYGVSGIDARSKPLSYLFSGNATASIYGVSIPFSFVFSEQERSFRQPFNQFGLSPKWKWVTLHLGYRSLNYSPFTMAGHNILGIGIDLNPGNFRFSFIFGRFQRAVAPGESGNANSTPAFKRRGLAAKVGYGTQKRFFDLVFLRVNDDSTSLRKDSALQIRPEADMVVGYNTHIEFIKKFTFESEAAFSLYTNDRTIQDSVPVSDGLLNACRKLTPVNSTSGKYTAFRAALMYREKKYSVKLEYKRLSPNYRSMGAYYFNNDIQQISLEPTAQLLKQKLNLRAGVGFQNDNLNKEKRATTMRLVSSFSFSYNPVNFFGIAGSYSNYYTNQKAGRLTLLDSAKYYQINENLIISPSFIIIKNEMVHVVLLSYNFMRLNDLNTYTEVSSEYSTHNAMVNYVLTMPKINMNVSAGVSFTSMIMDTVKYSLIGCNLSAARNFMNNKMNVSLPLSLQRTIYGNADGWIITAGPMASYKPFKHHSFSFSMNYIGNLISTPLSPAFHEFRGILGYIFTF